MQSLLECTLMLPTCLAQWKLPPRSRLTRRRVALLQPCHTLPSSRWHQRGGVCRDNMAATQRAASAAHPCVRLPTAVGALLHLLDLWPDTLPQCHFVRKNQKFENLWALPWHRHVVPDLRGKGLEYAAQKWRAATALWMVLHVRLRTPHEVRSRRPSVERRARSVAHEFFHQEGTTIWTEPCQTRRTVVVIWHKVVARTCQIFR